MMHPSSAGLRGVHCETGTLRGHRAPSLIFLGLVLQPLLSVVAQTQNSLREFLVPQFKRIDVLGHFVADRNCINRDLRLPAPSCCSCCCCRVDRSYWGPNTWLSRYLDCGLFYALVVIMR